MDNFVGDLFKGSKVTMHPLIIGDAIPEIILEKILNPNVRFNSYIQHLNMRCFLFNIICRLSVGVVFHMGAK